MQHQDPIKEEEEGEVEGLPEGTNIAPPKSEEKPLMSTEKTAVVAMLSLGSDESSVDGDGDASTIQSV